MGMGNPGGNLPNCVWSPPQVSFDFLSIVELLNIIYCLAQLVEFTAFIYLRIKLPHLPRCAPFFSSQPRLQQRICSSMLRSSMLRSSVERSSMERSHPRLLSSTLPHRPWARPQLCSHQHGRQRAWV